jgi:hypothetical protein
MRRITNESQNQKNKKLISLVNFDIIEGFTKDMAETTQTNASTVIENIILDQILSKSKTSNYYIKEIYDIGLKETFISLMQDLSAGIQGMASHDNAEELVKLGMSIVNRPFSAGMDEKHKELSEHHFPSNCRCVREKIEHETAEEKLEFDEKMAYEDDIMLLSQTENKACDFVPYNYFRLVLARWDILGNYTYTFRMLMDVVALSEEKLWDSAEYRLQAIEIIKKVTEMWDVY